MSNEYPDSFESGAFPRALAGLRDWYWYASGIIDDFAETFSLMHNVEHYQYRNSWYRWCGPDSIEQASEELEALNADPVVAGLFRAVADAIVLMDSNLMEGIPPPDQEDGGIILLDLALDQLEEFAGRKRDPIGWYSASFYRKEYDVRPASLRDAVRSGRLKNMKIEHDGGRTRTLYPFATVHELWPAETAHPLPPHMRENP